MHKKKDFFLKLFRSPFIMLVGWLNLVSHETNSLRWIIANGLTLKVGQETCYHGLCVLSICAL